MLKLLLILLTIPLFGCPPGGGTNTGGDLSDAANFNRTVQDYTSGDRIREEGCPNCQEDHPQGRATALSAPPPNMDATSRRAFEAYTRAGGDPKAFRQALCYLNRKKNEVIRTELGGFRMNPCILSIQDNTRITSNAAPIFRVDLCRGTSARGASAKGYGGICHGNAPCPINSGKTPNGFMLLGGRHDSEKVWAPGIKMHGLERFNRNNGARGIVMHRAIGARSGSYYCTDSGCPGGNSAGCTAMSQSWYNRYVHLRDARPTRGGTAVGELQFNFSNYEKRQSENYCGSN